ncbi:hypothetical protein VTJ04DRAFT_1477 [Mycothermus thermophilus]|uniref:uncharacterized protein n=1 Tax=Humicola insolens TaxID=85995 RepID=UPI003742E89F
MMQSVSALEHPCGSLCQGQTEQDPRTQDLVCEGLGSVNDLTLVSRVPGAIHLDFTLLQVPHIEPPPILRAASPTVSIYLPFEASSTRPSDLRRT